MTVDYNELANRVFKKLKLNPNEKSDDPVKAIYELISGTSIYNAIHVISEYEKMKKENQ